MASAILKNILCATDFSSNADHAFQYSLALASKIKARIFLMHAYESPVLFSESPATGLLNADTQIEKRINRKLNLRLTNAGKKFPAASVKTILRQGLPADEILKLAKESSFELIVLGKTGKGKMERFLLGSTASKIIQHAQCPVLFIPKGIKFRSYKKIVFATNLHGDNLNAADSLTDFAKRFQAEIIFLFVDTKHLIHDDQETVTTTKKIRQRFRYPKISGYICKNTDITSGIDFFIHHHSADLLAMYSHASSPASILHASTTKSMAAKTNLPLLVLEQPE